MKIYKETLDSTKFYPVFVSASEICELSGKHNEIENLENAYGFN